MTAPLDLTKPIMLPHDKKPWRVVYCDDLSVLVEGGALNARAHHARQYIDEYAENIPPEPPRGPEEIWVSVYHNGFVTWTACASEGAALDMIACVNPSRAGAAVRYIRADLAKRGMATEPLRVVSAEAVTWNDGSWGCPDPGVMYTQALVSGMRVLVEAGGAQYDYRFGTTSSPRLCEL